MSNLKNKLRALIDNKQNIACGGIFNGEIPKIYNEHEDYFYPEYQAKLNKLLEKETNDINKNINIIINIKSTHGGAW